MGGRAFSSAPLAPASSKPCSAGTPIPETAPLPAARLNPGCRASPLGPGCPWRHLREPKPALWRSPCRGVPARSTIPVRSTVPALLLGLFVQHPFFLFLLIPSFFFFFFPPFSPIGEPHDASLSASRRESPEDCFKKKSVCGAGRRGRAVLLTDDCTLERFAGGVPVPAAGPRTMASLRRPRPQPSHSPARGHGAATQKRRRRPTAAAPRAQSRRRAGHRPRAPAAALPH